MTIPRTRATMFLLVLAFLAGTFALSRTRPIDGDEGYYAPAARLVAEGQAPYRDFFYPQAPLMPYLYAPWYRAAGDSIVNMRGPSVLAGALTLALWAAFLLRRWGDRPRVAVAALLLVALNPAFVSWNVTVKTYALTNLAAFAVIWAADRARHGGGPGWFLAAGLAAVLAAGVRLLYLPWAAATLLILAGWAWTGREGGARIPRLLALAGGALLAAAPVAVFFFRSPDLFMFDNLEYHRLRFSPHASEGSALLAAAGTLLRAVAGNPYQLFVMILAGLGLVWARENRDHPHRPLVVLSGVAGAAYVATCLFPDPAYEQYFTGPLTPLTAPGAVAGLAWLADRLKRPTEVAVGAMALAAVLCVVDLGVRRVGMSDAEVWSVDHLARVKESIRARSKPGDTVLAFWSGYVFEAGREFVPGMENHFALGVSERLTLEEKLRYRVAGKEVLLRALETRHPTLVVLGAWMHEINTSLDQRHVPVINRELARRYEMEQVFGETKVCVRAPDPVRAN